MPKKLEPSAVIEAPPDSRYKGAVLLRLPPSLCTKLIRQLTELKTQYAVEMAFPVEGTSGRKYFRVAFELKVRDDNED